MSSSSDEQTVIDLEDCAVRVVDRERVATVTGAMPAGAGIAGLADVFGLLADAGRLRVLVALLEGEMCVCDLAAVTKASESAVSHHLRLLRAHRVVQVRRAGRMAYYRLADAHVRMLLDVALTHIGHAPAAAHPERPHPGPVPAGGPRPGSARSGFTFPGRGGG
ncbi:MAG TPA: metalloregulator ArsR/SmtB family transcription factor [Streptosporangiaceae bacterium]|nr:metalloregulator ArsR/SmtB family transcription factor [Streptosporangiaceae bacterium]